MRWFAYTYTYNLRFRRCVLPGRSIAGGHRNCRGRRTFAHRCVFFSMSPPRVCPTLRDLLFVWHVPFSNFVYWLILHTLQAKRKDTVTSSKSSTDQCRLVGLRSGVTETALIFSYSLGACRHVAHASTSPRRSDGRFRSRICA